MEKGRFGKKTLESYFLEHENPYSKRRPIKMKSLYIVGGVGIFIFISSVIFLGNRVEKKEVAKLDYSAHAGSVTPNADSQAGSIRASPDTPAHSGFFGGGGGGSGYFRGNSGGGSGSTRTRSANQVIHRGESGSDPGTRLPMGFGIPVMLLNAVLSTNSASPVIAEISQDVFPPNQSSSIASIPANTRAIGNATYDDTSQRIQIRFHTLVYPDGTQHGIQGLGLMSDGSAGVAGDYHSGETTRQIGKFLGNFVGGMADGMKDRTSGGYAGVPYEPGSIKNGILNGINQSAVDGTKDFSDHLSQTKPTMSLPAGQSFILYLEHEFSP